MLSCRGLLLCSLAVAVALGAVSRPLGEIVAIHETANGEKWFLYQNEPTICDRVKQYSGYFQLGSSDKQYFYWFFESRSSPATDPLIMWLTGGPGCSSQLALLVENGPCKVNNDSRTTTPNPYSWNENSNLMFVDQPPGTGFSEGSMDHDEKGVATDMYAFLQAFFGTYPQYNTSFFVIGESYAGHYVPAISHYIYQGNKAKLGNHINLKGLAIGNGLTDPEIQYAYYADMAYNSTTAPSVISKFTYNIMKAGIPSCINSIKKCQTSDSACSNAYLTCNLGQTTPVQRTGINPYDMRIPCEHGNLCYDFSKEEKFLNDADVQKQIGVSKKWESCNMIVNEMFRGDWMKNYHTEIPDMLEDGIRVLVYAGDVDFICNWLGNKAWSLALEWEGKDGFTKAPDAPWTVSGREAGILRTFEGFSFLQVFQAGHMVPMDQPQVALQMVNQFLNNTLSH